MERYRQSSVASSTGRVYGSAQERYKRFCRAAHSRPWPTSELLLCRFVTHLASENVSAATIKCYLAAIRHGHIAVGCGDPGICQMPRLEQVIKGIKLVQARSTSAGRSPKLPVTPALLRRMRCTWRAEGVQADREMLWAACTLCFFGFFRSGEIAIPTAGSFDPDSHLTFNDVMVDSLQSPQLVRVRLKVSKTDPFRRGVDVFVGRTGDDLCPVAAVLAYMVRRGSGPGPFFRFQDGSPLTRPRLVAEVKRVLEKAGVDSRAYAGHSFRSGAATTAAEQGVEDSVIKVLGRWRSSAYQLYVRTPRRKLAAFSKRLAGGNTRSSSPAS